MRWQSSPRAVCALASLWPQSSRLPGLFFALLLQRERPPN